MIFDTHAHYDDEQFDEDRDELLKSMPDLGVGTIVDVSATYESCEKVLALAGKYPYVYAAIGVHPDEVGELNEDKIQHMKELCRNKKVVAVGEIGLDYYWDTVTKEQQMKVFQWQMDLAKKHHKPVIIHCRDAYEDTYEVLKRNGHPGIIHSREAAADTMYIMKNYAQGLGGVIHCYSYSREMAEEYVKMGFYIGIGGVVTFKNAKKLKDVAAAIPIEKIVLETDCPYMAPEPYRGKRNQSSYIRYVAEKIAELKEMSPEEVIAVTEKNARDLYGI